MGVKEDGEWGVGRQDRRKGYAYQRCRACVDELMLRASWHDYQIAGFDVLVFAGYSRFALAGGEGEGLVDRVHLG